MQLHFCSLVIQHPSPVASKALINTRSLKKKRVRPLTLLCISHGLKIVSRVRAILPLFCTFMLCIYAQLHCWVRRSKLWNCDTGRKRCACVTCARRRREKLLIKLPFITFHCPAAHNKASSGRKKRPRERVIMHNVAESTSAGCSMTRLNSDTVMQTAFLDIYASKDWVQGSKKFSQFDSADILVTYFDY